jgi:hypothetical protein
MPVNSRSLRLARNKLEWLTGMRYIKARFIMIVATTQGRPQVEVGIPKCHFPLMARRQHSELAIARIAAL